MTIEQAIQILENRTGFQIIAEDCDVNAVYEAIQIVIDKVTERTL